ncbi:cobalamin-binding protein [Methanoculleus sp. Wushi-C6]|uniref:Cobalamin-binding protein n=1 Tax=Methanoculleus caldifontis TaxID=2651577 RepID=A0ABU3X387_9EURY|nr:cobalamin-dependent protein [Methanoculleus sp. Wushi-C6]MDV2482530.1 cobalamin-binding protein [Methanoculleus sp. Wushi-C6]
MGPEFQDLPGRAAPLSSSGDELKEALLGVDRMRAGKIIRDACAAGSPVDCIEGLIIPVLEEIGRDWEQGQVALSQVYISGRICEEVVNTMLPPGSPSRRHRPKIAIAVLEDHHTLGKQIILAVLRAGGYEVIDYGSGVTVDSLVESVIRDRIEILLISTLMLPAALRAREAIARIREAMPEVRVIVGGAPFRFDPALWRETGADAFGCSASETLEAVRMMGGAVWPER